jgi:hypothetical protein
MPVGAADEISNLEKPCKNIFIQLAYAQREHEE